MPAIIWRKLVIDASVARACGGPDASYPASIYCRDFLLGVQAGRYSVIITSDITAEWDKHQSRFARVWLTEMRKRGRVFFPVIVTDQVLRARIESVAYENDRVAMLKDLLLIEAALAADKTIISLDEKVRKAFGANARAITELQAIVWVNPTRVAEEQPLDWLKDAAKANKERLLGFEPT